MVSIVLSTILVTAAEIPQIKNANAEKSPPFEEFVFCTVPWFVSFGILLDLDSLAAAWVPGAASCPSEMLQALQSRNERECGAAVESLALLATLAQSCAHFEGKGDGPMRFREALGRLAPSYKKALIGRLSDPNPKIRNLAGATVLVLEPDNQEALHVVVNGLRMKDLYLLKNIGPLRLTQKKVIASLVDGLRSKDGKVQRAAARVVMEIGPPAKAAIPALLEILKSKEAVDYDFVPWLAVTFPRRANLALEALEAMGPSAAPAVPALIEMLQTPDNEDRGDILICLACIGPAAQKAVLPIRQLLKLEVKSHVPNLLRATPELDISLGAACALLRILPGDNQALSVVKDSLRSSDKNVRRLALEACAQCKVKEKSLVESFIKALKEEHLREAAANALAEVGPDAKDAIPILLEILLNERSNHSHNNEAVRALAAIGKQAVPTLAEVALDQDSAARSVAIFALSQLDGEEKLAVPILINALNDDRLIATIALGKLGGKARRAGVSLLVFYLVDSLGTNEELLALERWAVRQVSNLRLVSDHVGDDEFKKP